MLIYATTPSGMASKTGKVKFSSEQALIIFLVNLTFPVFSGIVSRPGQ